MTSFDSLPVGAVIENNDGKILALHAGLFFIFIFIC